MTGADEDRLEELLDELRALKHGVSGGNIVALLPKLRSISRRYLPAKSALRDGLDSEDLAQEGLVKLLEHVDSFRGKTMAEFLAFAKSVVGREAVRHSRWQRVRRRELGASAPAEQHALESRSPSVDAVQEEDKQRLRKLVETLGEDQREALELRLEGLDNGEIAARLGLREDLVRKRLSRALKELQRRW